MLKKTALTAMVAMLAASLAYAGSQNDAGCGIGSLIFKSNDMPSQVLAGTTNQDSSQSSSITSGIAGCTAANGNAKLSKNQRAEKKQDAFVTQNWRDLNREMASGGGEYVSTLSNLMGCSKNAQSAFAHFTQTHYTTITGGAKTTPAVVVKNLRAAVAQDPQMSMSCSLI